MDWNEIFGIIIDLSNNIFILLVLVLLYATSNFEIKNTKISKQILAGLVIGAATLFIMSNPFNFQDGIIFDTRTIVFTISGLFFGPIATIISAIIAITYRIFLGGSGTLVGVATVIFSGAIGIYWKYLTHNIKFKNKYLEYFIIGLVVHIIAISMFLTLPNNVMVTQVMLIPFIVLFPIITMYLGVIMDQQKNRIALSKLEEAHQLLMKYTAEYNRTIEIYALDKNFNYLTFNQFHFHEMKRYYDIDIQVGDNFLKLLNSDSMKARYLQTFEKVLKGNPLSTTSEVEDVRGKYLEEIFSPIIKDGEITGITVFVRNVTEQKTYEESIIKLSYHDALTGVYNRRFFEEKIGKLQESNIEPIAVISCDINGLKLVNDTFGHRMGDQVIIRASKILEEYFSETGFVCRMGGDEFVIIQPNMDQKTATSIMEKVLFSLDQEKLSGITLSLSYGIAVKTKEIKFRDVIKLSEELMYRHKLFESDSHRSEFIKTILQSLHEKNPREEMHSKRVAAICVGIGKHLQMKKDELNLLRAISSLHDIGKIAIDEAILNKPGKLTDEEWETIKRHPEIGFRIISTAPEYSEIAQDILSHHERFDGKGYPRGLKGEEIPIRARIVSIADAYDAMISKRTYRDPLSKEDAVNEIKRCSGTQFDPELVKIFVNIIEEVEND